MDILRSVFWGVVAAAVVGAVLTFVGGLLLALAAAVPTLIAVGVIVSVLSKKVRIEVTRDGR